MRDSMAAMQHRGKIVILLWLAACGDNGATPTTSLTTTQPLTSGPSNETSNEVSGSTVEPTGAHPDSTSAAAETTMAPPEQTTTGAVTGSPVFLSFGTNVTKITDGESVTFTAILTDPDGVADIVGGSLLSEDESIDFGPFVAAGQEGTYSIVLSWAQIHQADPIGFEGTGISRVFQARFFDQMANKVTQTTQIDLFCAKGGACDGECKDFTTDGKHCGACGRVCDGGVDACIGSACSPLWSSCFDDSDGFNTCDEVCASTSETCVEKGCGAGKTVAAYDTPDQCEEYFGEVYPVQPCSEQQEWGFGQHAIRCCCTDTK